MSRAMTDSPPAANLPQHAPISEGRHASLLRRALMVGLFALFGLALVAIILVMVVVITHGGGIQRVE